MLPPEQRTRAYISSTADIQANTPTNAEERTMLAKLTSLWPLAAGSNSRKECFVIHKGKIYEVSGFLLDHPGGAELIEEYRGKDISHVLEDPYGHMHSEVAFQMLDEFYVGDVLEDGQQTPDATDEEGSVSSKLQEGENEDALSLERKRSDSALCSDNPAASTQAKVQDMTQKEQELRQRRHEPIPKKTTEQVKDMSKALYGLKKDPNFLDLNKPLILQMLRCNYSKAYYMEQVHIPRHIPHIAPFLGGVLELLTRTPWFVVPIVWVPFSTYMFLQGIAILDWKVAVPLYIFAALSFTFVEYCIHRFLFHVEDALPDHPLALTAHFVFHGVHHFLPMDRMRLVLPPALLVILGTPILAAIFTILPLGVAYIYTSGLFTGYMAYDLTHYYLHHATISNTGPVGRYMKDIKRYHLDHHYKNADLGFGITNKFWDWIFDTML